MGTAEKTHSIRVAVSLLLVTASALPAQKAVLWRDPGLLDKLDLASGPGGPRLRPRPPYRFLKVMGGGTNKKVEVKDARNVTWRVKFGTEARPDAFCSRLAWACGYYADPIHVVQDSRIEGAPDLSGFRSPIDRDGSFKLAVFETTPTYLEYLPGQTWRWDQNPFVGTHSLNGLKIIVMLVSNWDNKDEREKEQTGSNVGILRDTRTGRLQYYVNDWGESMGTWGNHDITRHRWDCGRFRGQTPKFLHFAGGGFEFGFEGYHTDFKTGIAPADIAWLLKYLGRLTPAQIEAALNASGAAPDETACFTRDLLARISQLRQAAQPRPSH